MLYTICVCVVIHTVIYKWANRIASYIKWILLNCTEKFFASWNNSSSYSYITMVLSLVTKSEKSAKTKTHALLLAHLRQKKTREEFQDHCYVEKIKKITLGRRSIFEKKKLGVIVFVVISFLLERKFTYIYTVVVLLGKCLCSKNKQKML